ncbi:3-oxoadipate enol-lactonase [Amycolatopsis taiwanensis]|uniref:3-oxoadipate enol-lactonase n=1 Tax=Amycolatopsis taiwanensis TaxID=342230 RepID=A0A9W6QXR9_9PSEU|nr:3-oxoadipate enol-lactonase [Amycolatopsis taiwanensis]GLY65981.1 3-oxoadipate enol-lactonase [Amycolatopsis taiwanensis]
MSVEVQYVIDGPEDGDVVVLSNSLGSDLHMWDPQVKPLVDNGFRVVRYDTRGHGRSVVPEGPYTIGELGEDVVALLDRIGVPSAHFVGLSLGGMTAIQLGRHAPGRVRSLVLCCTSARPGNRQMWLDRAATVRAHGMAEIADGALGRWFTPAWRAENPELAREMREMIARTPAAGYAACCEVLADLDLTGDLPAITAPTLVISGSDDQALPPEHGRLIAAGVPGARYELVGPAAHLGNVERPEQFSRLITEHLKAVGHE